VGAAHAFCFIGSGASQIHGSEENSPPKGKEESMSTHARLQELIEPIVTGLGLELFDLHHTGGTLAVLIDRPRPVGLTGPRPGVDLAAITAVTRAISRMIDEVDPIPGHFSLEVSSPGLERPLRTPAHFAGAVGELVAIKAVPAFEGPRRVRGTLVRAGGDHDEARERSVRTSIDLRLDEPAGELLTLAYDDIEKARTVFEWGGEPKAAKPDRAPKSGRAKQTGRPPKGGRAASVSTPSTPPEPGGPDTANDHGPSAAPERSAPSGGPDAKINGDDQKVSAT
jgi:ribosome maturation factor RimP